MLFLICINICRRLWPISFVSQHSSLYNSAGDHGRKKENISIAGRTFFIPLLLHLWCCCRNSCCSTTTIPSRFFSALQLYCSHFLVCLLSYDSRLTLIRLHCSIFYGRDIYIWVGILPGLLLSKAATLWPAFFSVCTHRMKEKEKNEKSFFTSRPNFFLQ